MTKHFFDGKSVFITQSSKSGSPSTISVAQERQASPFSSDFNSVGMFTVIGNTYTRNQTLLLFSWGQMVPRVGMYKLRGMEIT